MVVWMHICLSYLIMELYLLKIIIEYTTSLLWYEVKFRII